MSWFSGKEKRTIEICNLAEQMRDLGLKPLGVLKIFQMAIEDDDIVDEIKLALATDNFEMLRRKTGIQL